MVRMELTADDSLAAIRARNRFGIAMAAMIRMIATTISNSISEKPFCFRISFLPFSVFEFGLVDPLAVTSHFSGQNSRVEPAGAVLLEPILFSPTKRQQATWTKLFRGANRGAGYQILTWD